MNLLCFLLAVLHYTLLSPDGGIRADIRTDEGISYSVSVDGKTVLAPSAVDMTLGDGTRIGAKCKGAKVTTRTVDTRLQTVVYRKSEVQDCFNELTLRLPAADIIWRAYDDGVAYRIVSRSRKSVTVVSETVEYNFAADYRAKVPYVSLKKSYPSQFATSFERRYASTSLSSWEKERLAFLPLMVDAGNAELLVMEADLLHYPGLYLVNNDGDTALEGVFAPLPDKVEQGGHNNFQGVVKSVKPCIAEAAPFEAFPWRILAVARRDADLADCDLVYRLSRQEDSRDWSWIKPGKVSWDWWCAWNLYGVDFKAGINTRTYEYFIDFASRFGLEYVLLDEGWAVPGAVDMMQVVDALDLPHLCRYAQERGVGLLLWGGFWAFNRDMEGLCRHYSEMGVKGFKIDFMNRDDQMMVDFCARAAEMAAKYKLVIDFHGVFKPAGLQRTWPNVLNFEGVFGLEQMKWLSETDMPDYDVTIPYIRMASGPMDYTQGAMRNANKKNYRPVGSEPMSQGTRTHQAAEYIVFDSPLVMLCDSPSAYEAEPDYTRLIASVPTVWEETRILDGKVGEFIVTARRAGGQWYVGALTNWTERELEIPLDFLGEGVWQVELCVDGPNAGRAARDYALRTLQVRAGERLPARLASGGGWFARFTPVK